MFTTLAALAILLSRLNIALAQTAQYEIKPPNIWSGYENLKAICSCESWGDPNKEPRQYDERGRIIRGQTTPDDIGVCQISQKYHAAEADALGFSLRTYEGNISYSKVLWNREKGSPWRASMGCHHVK